jgi:hypothetical protein
MRGMRKTNVYSVYLKGINHFGDLGIDGKIMLDWILGK